MTVLKKFLLKLSRLITEYKDLKVGRYYSETVYKIKEMKYLKS